MPRQTSDIHLIIQFLAFFSHISEYANLRTQFFYEYFDNRKYLLEVYLDAVSNAYEKQVKSNEFSAAFIGKYLDILEEEKQYFLLQFSEKEIGRF